MLNCRQVTDKSSALVDGELGLRERMSIRLHLLMCVHCRRFNQQFRRLVESMSLREEAGVVSEEFVDQVMTEVDRAAAGDSEPR